MTLILKYGPRCVHDIGQGQQDELGKKNTAGTEDERRRTCLITFSRVCVPQRREPSVDWFRNEV